MDSTDRAVGALVEDLVASIQAVLGGDLVAAYLYGSYVSGGFDPDVSDLDLVAVTSSEADELDLAGLEQMHRDLVGWHPSWDDRIEVAYIGRATLASFRTSLGRLAVISPGEPFHLRDDRVAAWVQNWYLVRTTGVALHGPSAEAHVPPVSWSEFAAATAQYAKQLTGRSLADSSPASVAYAVLTMSRAVTTVRTQTLPSKQEGAAWVRRAFPQWSWLVDEALLCRLARGTVGFSDQQTRAAADELIGFLAAEITAPPA